MAEITKAENLREEFNRWAEAGRGEGMEQDHLPITLPVLEKMRIAPPDNILDVGCGAGWLSRRLAKLVPEGRVVGMDISDEMIRHARRSSMDFDNLMFIAGEVAQIPWQPNFFSHAIAVESSYYWPNPAAGVKDVFRVLSDGGSAWILINYYRDNPHCHQWGPLLAVPTHLLSGEEWAGYSVMRDLRTSRTSASLIYPRRRKSIQAVGSATRHIFAPSRKKEHCSFTERSRKAGYFLNQKAQVRLLPALLLLTLILAIHPLGP